MYLSLSLSVYRDGSQSFPGGGGVDRPREKFLYTTLQTLPPEHQVQYCIYVQTLGINKCVGFAGQDLRV